MPAGTPQKTALILIADADTNVRATLLAALDAENVRFVEASDGTSCLAACQEHHPDLVIVSEPLASASDLCRVLHNLPDQERAAVLLILDNSEVDASELLDCADDYVLKPVQHGLLCRRALALLRKRALEVGVRFQEELLSQMADAVIALDINRNITYWNAEAERMYGISAGEIVGSSADRAFTTPYESPEAFAAYHDTLNRVGSWRGEVVHQSRSGQRMDVEVSARLLTNADSEPVGSIAVIRDISERKRIEVALREQRELADALRDIASALTRTLDPQSVMRLILDHVGRVVPNTTANILLIEGDQAHIGFSRGYSPEAKAKLEGLTYPVHEIATFREMLTTGQSYLIADTRENAAWPKMPELAWIRSYLGTPIRAYDHVIGFLNLDSPEPNTFTPVHAERLRVFADQAAIAIENAQLYDAIYRDAVEMRALQRATGLLYLSDLFSSENVVDMCGQIARVVVNEFGKVDCGVMLVDETNGMITRVARAGEFQVPGGRPLYLSGPGLVPESARSGQTIYAADVRQDERYLPNNPDTISELAVPLRTAQRVIGVLDLQSAQENAFDSNDVRLIEVFAERAAVAIENVKLYNEIRRYADELERRVQERTAELNRIKERVEAILNHSSDAILLIRTNGSIQQGNRSFERMFGYQNDDAFGKPITALTEPDYQESLTEALSRVLEKSSPERLELVAQRLNGQTFDADVMLSPVVTPPQPISSIVCSVRDITQRKRLEAELRDALYKERELNELKSRFIARASHEFRTPLAVILTSSDLLKNYGTRMSAEQREEKLNRLQKEVRNIALMLDDVLTISKGDELKEFNPELLDLLGVARETVSELRDGIGTQHAIVFETRGDCSSVYADKILIRRIITNLISNAVKYSPSGSTIRVNVTCEANRTTLSVADEGIGIPEEDQTRLFEAFHRARNVDHISGTGLGLAIVKQAVELHGGEVNVDSQLGKGTTFTVTLPNLAVRERSS